MHLPIHYEDENQGGKPAVAWDFNLLSLDGYSPETGWVRIDTKKLASVHISSFEKRRSVQRKASHSKKARRVLSKYSRRETERENTNSKSLVSFNHCVVLWASKSSKSRGCTHARVCGIG